MKSLIAVALLFSVQITFAQVKPLAKEDAIAKVAAHFNTEWGDGNITSGTTEIAAFKWDSVASKKEMIKDQVEMLNKELEARSKGASQKLSGLKVTSKKFANADAFKIGKAYAIGNDFTDTDNEESKRAMGQVYAILAKLGDVKDLLTIEVQAVYNEESDESEDSLKVYLYSVTNMKTSKAVSFHIIQGRM
jgi:hypothetical protein